MSQVAKYIIPLIVLTTGTLFWGGMAFVSVKAALLIAGMGLGIVALVVLSGFAIRSVLAPHDDADQFTPADWRDMEDI